MHFSRHNLNHTLVHAPKDDKGLYEIRFDDLDMLVSLDPIDYRGLKIAERLRNAGIPTDLMMALESYISEYTSREVGYEMAGEDL